jgi:hypothetical protein
MKFYPQDWRADEKLRLCSLAARGLWIEVLALMHRSERYGQLLIGGRIPTDAQLAVQVGAPTNQVTDLLAELETNDVFSRTRNGVIYSRRMIRDAKRAETARKNGEKGGNPRLGNKKGFSAWDNPQDKPSVKGGDKPQRPEARDQTKPLTPLLVEPAQEGGSKYVFEGKTIRLIERDFQQWRQSFHAIPDLTAALQGLDDWLQGPNVPDAKRKNWFNVVSALLGRKHDEAMTKGREEDEAHAAFLARNPTQCLPESEWRALIGDEAFERRKDRLKIREGGK